MLHYENVIDVLLYLWLSCKILLSVADPKEVGQVGDCPQMINQMYGFSINKRLLTGPQFTTNISTRSIFYQDRTK